MIKVKTTYICDFCNNIVLDSKKIKFFSVIECTPNGQQFGKIKRIDICDVCETYLNNLHNKAVLEGKMYIKEEKDERISQN